MKILTILSNGIKETDSLIIFSCLAITLLIAFGYSAYQKLVKLNQSHPIISWDEDDVYMTFEDEDDI